MKIFRRSGPATGVGSPGIRTAVNNPALLRCARYERRYWIRRADDVHARRSAHHNLWETYGAYWSPDGAINLHDLDRKGAPGRYEVRVTSFNPIQQYLGRGNSHASSGAQPRNRRVVSRWQRGCCYDAVRLRIGCCGSSRVTDETVKSRRLRERNLWSVI